MQDKKFMGIAGGITIVFLLSWAFVISPSQQDVQKYRKKHKNIYNLTKKIHMQDYPPQKSIQSDLTAKQNSLEKRINILKKHIHFNYKPPSSNLSNVNFREDLNSKVSSIQSYTNPLGIKFNNELGFKSTINQISKQHYIHLELAYYSTKKLMQLVTENSEKIIFHSIKHISLNNEEENAKLVTSYSLNIQISISLKLGMMWLHQLSLPMAKKQDIFFRISHVKIKNDSENLVHLNVVLSAAKINLGGTNNKKNSTTNNNNGEDEDEDDDSLWRY